MAEQVDLGFDVALEIHVIKSGKLHKQYRVGRAAGRRIAQKVDTDKLARETKPEDRPSQPIDLGGLTRVSIRAGPSIVILRGCRDRHLCQYCHGCEHADRKVAHPDNMGTRPEYLEKGDDVIEKVVELEGSVLQPDYLGHCASR